MSIIIEYFDVEFKMVDKSPQIKLILKETKKITKTPLFKQSGQPYSGSQLEYWVNYLGDVNGNLVYNERRKLFSKTKLVKWYVNNFNPTNSVELSEYADSIGTKISIKLKEHYNSEDGNLTKIKLKERNKIWAPIIGKLNKDRWNDPIWVESEMKRRNDTCHYEKVSEHNKERMKDPDFVERFKQACNEPKRIKKISNSSKQMWKDAKTNDVEKYRRMLMSQKNKNYELNGYVMNAIEYQIGNLLNDMNLVWEYERIFNINENSYLPDFYLPDYDIIIECYGDFWHANPKYMTPTDTTHKYITAIDIWNRDKQRVDNLRLCVKNVVCLWEDDIINDINNCKQLIKENI